MKYLLKIALISAILLFPLATNAQVLITLLFGDALNTEKIEFGLVGGLNRSYILDIEDSKGLNNFNLGFYFHINIKNSSYLSTGTLVKSDMGAKGMKPYAIGDPEFDSVFQNSTLKKKISSFYIPILYHHRFNNKWYIEAGPQLGLIFKPLDIFDVSEYGGDLSYKRKVMDEYKRIDVGLYGAVGYKFKQEIKSISAGIGYYYGLVNVSKMPDLEIRNSSIYFFVKIPIEPKKKEKKEKKN
jgi:hypothetical protein